MGDRGAANEEATDEDIAKMAAVVSESVRAGALGFSTSRTEIHASVEGVPVPGTYADERELLALAKASHAAGGIMEMVPAGIAGEAEGLMRETEMMERIARESGCLMTFLLLQHRLDSTEWRKQLDLCEAALRDGVRLVPQVAARPPAILFSFQGDNPFEYLPSFQPLKKLSFEQKIERLRDPELRATLLSEKDPNTTGMSLIYNSPDVWECTNPMGEPLSYTPEAGKNVAEIARREGRNPREVAYDLMLENDGRTFLMYAVVNYADGNSDAMKEMLTSPATVLGLSDAGAHVRQVIDASIHTYMLTHWVRGFDEGPSLSPTPRVRGEAAHPGQREALWFRRPGDAARGREGGHQRDRLRQPQGEPPERRPRPPAGMPRLMQTAEGYSHTLVAGETVTEGGKLTGARPGQVLR